MFGLIENMQRNTQIYLMCNENILQQVQRKDSCNLTIYVIAHLLALSTCNFLGLITTSFKDACNINKK